MSDNENLKDQLIELLTETQKQYSESNRMKDKIIRLLIVLMFLEAAIGYAGFVWYESQFEYAVEETTTTTTETHETDNSKDIDINSEGEGSEATYIDGNQYNDSSSHNEGGDSE